MAELNQNNKQFLNNVLKNDVGLYIEQINALKYLGGGEKGRVFVRKNQSYLAVFFPLFLPSTHFPA